MRKLLCCLTVFVLLGIQGWAQNDPCDGYGVEVEVVTEHNYDAGDPLAVLNGMTTYRLYATTAGTDDFVSAIVGDVNNPISVETTTSFYQDVMFGGATGDVINSALLGLFPTLAYDSWVTVGREDNSIPAGESYGAINTIFGEVDWVSAFEGGNDIVINDGIGGGWFALNGDDNGVAGDDNRVLVAQLTTDGDISGNLYIQFFPDGSGADEFRCTIPFSSVATDIEGCTDPGAANYNPDATIDDGSCIFPGCTDPTACNYDPAATVDDGSCILPGDSCDDGDATTVGDEIQADCSCAGVQVPGCTDIAACNYDPAATVDDGSCLFPGDACDDGDATTVGDEIQADCSCAGVQVPGCTDIAACNYDPAATVDDGSCIFPGDACDDGDATTVGDEIQADCSCAGVQVPGCTDIAACNYDPAATVDDGSCFFVGDSCDDGDAGTMMDTVQADCSCAGVVIVEGCTDPDAINYNPDANEDDGSCEFEVPCDADAGSLTANQNDCYLAGDDIVLSAQTAGTPFVPSGYEVLYVLTEGAGLVIVDVNGTPDFVVPAVESSYTIHTLVYDPNTLDLGIVVPGVTTGFDVNSLLIQGGGDICAALDVAGAAFDVNICVEGCTDPEAINYNPDAVVDDGSCEFPCLADSGSLVTEQPDCYEGTVAELSASHDVEPTVPDGYEVIYVLTQGDGLVIVGVNDAPAFAVDVVPSSYTIHTLVYDPNTLDLGIVEPGVTTGFDVNSLLIQGGGDICASLDVAGAPIQVVPCDFDCMVMCPDDITVECDEDVDTGMPTLMGNCDGYEIMMLEDVVEGDDCETIITRSWQISVFQDPVQICTQTITIVDTTAPEFIDLPENIVVECIEDVPAPEEVSAEDNCTSVISVDQFSSETGFEVEACVFSTAFAPGDDWALWLPVLAADGLADSQSFVPSAEGLNFSVYNDGTAHIYGVVENSENPDQRFEVSVWLENQRDWAEWSALGRSYKDSFGFAAAGGDLWETWDFYELVNGFSVLTGLDDYAGNELYLYHMPASYYFGFQCGEAANDRNANFGMSGWFTYDGFVGGEAVEGHGDFNVDKECEEGNGQECVNDDEFTYFYRAEDECGNVNISSYTVTVEDTTAPEFTVVPEDITVECDELPVPVFEGVEAIDNCECGVEVINYLGEEIAEGGNSCEYQILRTWAAFDCCGNRADHVQTITVVDTTAPEATFIPEDITVECDEEIPYVAAEGVDNCQDVVIVSPEDEIIEGDCPQEYTIERYFLLDDGCGNIATVGPQIITVVDTTAPVFDEYPIQVSVECDELESVAIPTATDNCGEVTITYEDVLNSGGCLGTIERIITAADECGNETVVEQFITLLDTTAPVIENPADETVECDNVPEAPALEEIISDNCTAFEDLDIEFTEVITEGLCEDNYTITWTWTVTDNCENVTTATTVITVQDTTNPVILEGPADITLECDEEIPACDPESIVAEDNCDMDIVVECTDNIIDGDCPQEYTIERIYRAFDNCGNQAIYAQYITVVDTTAPVFTEVPGEIDVECDQEVPVTEAMAEDNCGAVSIEYSDEEFEGECPQEYSILRTFTATDECGNSTTATQTINVVDTTAPEFEAYEIEVDVPCDNIDLAMLTATDNCDDEVEITYIDMPVSGGCTGTIIRDYVAVDCSGNEATAQQIIHLFDDEAPVFVEAPEDVTVECDNIPAVEDMDGGELAEGEIGPGAFVRSNASLWNENSQVEHINALNALYGEGNWSDLRFEDVDVDDLLADHDFIYLEGGDEGGVPMANFLAANLPAIENWVDNGGHLLMNASPNNGGNIDFGFGGVTLVYPDFTEEASASDASHPIFAGGIATDYVGDWFGHSIICPPGMSAIMNRTGSPESVVLAEMNYGDGLVVFGGTTLPFFGHNSWAPQPDCAQLAFEILAYTAGGTNPGNGGGNGGIVVEDNCDDEVEVEYLGEEIIEGDCPNNYTIVRTWLATDHCDNEATHVQNITVEDTTAPEFEFVAEDVTVECDQELPAPEALAFDNCGEVTITVDPVITDGECANEYVMVRTYTATDECGNSATATQTLTVVDTTAPVFTEVPGEIDVECDQEVPVTEAMAEDNCGDVEVTYSDEELEGECPNEYSIIRTFVAVDACGNSSSATQNINVVDTTAPEFEAYEIEIEAPCDNVDVAVLSASDNCGDVEVSYIDTPVSGGCAGRIIRDYVAIDECGNEATAQQIITLTDEVAPVASNEPADASYECDEEIPFSEPSFEDNCDDELDIDYSEEQIDGDCPQAYTLVRTWTATDHCDNVTVVTQTISVDDTTAPMFTMVGESVTIECTMEVPAPMAEAMDNCDEDVMIDISSEMTEGDCPQEYTMIRTYTATDDCGNTAVAQQTITVVDTTAPVFTSIPEDITYECDEEIAEVNAEAEDNCGMVVVEWSDEQIDGECPQSYTIIRTFVATDECGNSSEASQTITVEDTTAPEFMEIPMDMEVECQSDVPALVEPMAMDNCGAVTVECNEVSDLDECGNGVIIRTCTATDECGNSTQIQYTISINDTTAPELVGTPEDLVLDCADDVPAAADVTAVDNCDDNLMVEYSEELIGDLPVEGSSADCVASTPETYEDGETCAGTEPWSLVLFDFNEEDASYYSTIDVSWVEFPDGSATLTGTVFCNANPEAGWEINAEFENGLPWEEWSTQGFPTSYKDDCGIAGDNYLDWTYYIMTAGATLTGWGDYEGSVLNLSHAPSNYYYGYQVGVAANNVNENYGGGGWFTYDGIFNGTEVNGSGDFAFDHDCCPQYSIERTWCVTDCSGNETCYTQVISFADLAGENPIIDIDAEEAYNAKGDFQIVKITPNPTSDLARVEFKANTNNTVILEVVDLSGRVVDVAFNGNIVNGETYRSVVDTRELESGIYTIRLYSLSHADNKKLVVTK